MKLEKLLSNSKSKMNDYFLDTKGNAWKKNKFTRAIVGLSNLLHLDLFDKVKVAEKIGTKETTSYITAQKLVEIEKKFEKNAPKENKQKIYDAFSDALGKYDKSNHNYYERNIQPIPDKFENVKLEEEE